MTESIIKESKIPPKTLGDNACDETQREAVVTQFVVASNWAGSQRSRCTFWKLKGTRSLAIHFLQICME